MSDIMGYVKGDRDWHKVEKQEVKRKLGSARKYSLSKCKLDLFDLDLQESPTDSDPVCSDCNK